MLKAAEKVFSQKGFAATTTDEVAELAGVSNSVMYRNFPTKGDLFREAVLQPFVEFLKNFTAVRPDPTDPDWDAYRLMVEYVAMMYDNLRSHRDALVGLVAAGPSLDAESSTRIAALFEQIIGELRDIGEDESRYRPNVSPTDMELTQRLSLSMIAGLVTFSPWLMPHGRNRVSRDHVIEHVSNLLSYGLRLQPPEVNT